MQTYTEILNILRSLLSWNYNFVGGTILTVQSTSGKRCIVAIIWLLHTQCVLLKMNDNNISKVFLTYALIISMSTHQLYFVLEHILP